MVTVVEPRKLTPIVLEAGSGRQWPVEPASGLPAADPQPVRAATTQILSPPLPLVVNSATVPDLCSCVFIPLELQVYIMIVLFIVIRFS